MLYRTTCVLVLLNCCYSREQRPSQCPEVILRVPEGGSCSHRLNTSAMSLTMSKCFNSTFGCEEVLLANAKNGRANLQNSSIVVPKGISFNGTHFHMDNASKAAEASYKIVENMDDSCVAFIRLIVEGPVQSPGNNQAVAVAVVVVVAAAAAAALAWRWSRHKKHHSLVETATELVEINNQSSSNRDQQCASLM